ncbi:MAG: DsbA family oxidoreductase [Sphingomonadaceae bacterium]|nr:DsbA family oxidoreductase [Sphingomonadaceae bacterium]
MSAPYRLVIDVWSDVMCPWCAIGYGQLSKALAELDGEIEAEVRWRPFELNPDMPVTGEEQGAHLARKYRRSPEETEAVRGQMKAIADSAGVSLAFEGDGDAPPAMMWNTFAAHCLLVWALEAYGPAKQTELKLALFRAHFNQRRRIGARDVLLDVAEEVGLDRAGALAALSDPAIGARVRAEEKQAWDMNISGVPAMVVQGKFLIPGAQAPETYVTALRRVVERGL